MEGPVLGKHLLGMLKKWAKGELVLFVLFISITLSVGCLDGGDKSESASDDATSESIVGLQTYSVTGRVRSITPDRDFIMVYHDAIEGLMDAMTMPFAVQDTTLVSGLTAGDSVHFEISVGNGEAVVTSIKIRP